MARMHFPGAVAFALVLGAIAAPPAWGQDGGVAVPVTVSAVEARAISESVSVTGRVEAIDRVDLVARVDGFLEEVAFTEGQTVGEGALLYRLERDMFEAEVRQAEGILEQARAAKVLADIELERAQQLLDREVGTVQARDIARAGADRSAGQVAEAEARLAQAQVNLGYTEIRAPVGGRIGMSALTRGAVVGPSSGVLATIVSQDPMHVTFPLSAREFLRDKPVDRANIRVRIALADGTFYGQEGTLDFVDVTVDEGTDTVLARTTLANPDRQLIDGQLVTVTLEAGTPEEQPVVAQSALVADQGGLYVFTVEDGKAAVRRVRIAGASGREAVVAEGLRPGDLVIVEGLERVRPGMAVVATPAEPAAEAGGSGSGSGSGAAGSGASGSGAN